MKAVIYHADAHVVWGDSPSDLYEVIIKWFREQLHKFDIELIHLSTEEHPEWGDINYHFQGDPKEPMYNREVFFTRFLRDYAKNGWYWFTEPDMIIHKMFPMPNADAMLLLRDEDSVKLSPCFRLAKRSALPLFEEVLSCYDLEKKDWHGDSAAFIEVYKRMGKPSLGMTRIKDVSVELRSHRDYIHQSGGKYMSHHKAANKISLYKSIKGE